jgi:hypothetical protein
MADEPIQQAAPPIPDSIPVTDPTAPQSIPIDLNPEYDPAKDTRAPFLKVNPNPKGPTVEAAPKPTILERAKKVVTEGIPQFSTRTVANPKYGQQQFLAPEEAMTPEERRQAPVAAGALEAAGGLTSPATVATVAATAGLGEAGVIPKVLSGLFAGQIAKSVYDQYPALKAAVDKAQHAKSSEEHDDAFSDAQRILTHMGADTVMGLLAAKHGAEGAKEILDTATGSGVPDQASTFKALKGPAAPEPEETHPEMNRETVKKLQDLGYSTQHITNFNIGEIRDILKNETPAAEHPVSQPVPPVTAPDPDAFAEAGGKLVGPSPKATVSTPAETPIKISTDNNGVKWAENTDGVRVSVPQRIPEAQVQEYAAQQIDAQTKMQAAVKAKTATPDPIESLIMSDKIGGKKVRGATSTAATTLADPEAFAEAGGKFVGKAPEHLYSREGAQTLADHIGAKVVGGVAEKGTSAHDLDLQVDAYDQPKIEAAMAAKGFEPTGSSVVSPAEAKSSGKSFGGGPTDWSRAHHFESVSEPRQKVDIWHNESAPAVEYHPDLQKVIDLPGVKVHQDPKQVTEAAHFVTPDGKFVRLPAGVDHDAVINTVRPDQMAYDPRVSFINDTGAIRIRPTIDRAGHTLHVSVPTEGVTPEQVDALKQSVGAGMKSRGNMILETAATPQDLKTADQEMVSPRHVDDMLKEIGAHPDQAKAAEAPKNEQLTAHETTGGSTFTPEGKNLAGKDLYAVGAYPDRTMQVDKLTPEVLTKFKTDNADILSKSNHAVGTWLDTDTGKSVLDISKTYTNREKGIAAGKAANQKAIYHLGGEGEIQTGGTAGEVPEAVGDTSFDFGANVKSAHEENTAKVAEMMKTKQEAMKKGLSSLNKSSKK